jgi:hypothetical protein
MTDEPGPVGPGKSYRPTEKRLDREIRTRMVGLLGMD